MMSRSSTFLQSGRNQRNIIKNCFLIFSMSKILVYIPAAGINIAGFSPILIHFLRCFWPQKCARAIGGYGRSTLQLSQKILSCFFSSIGNISIENYIEIQKSSTSPLAELVYFVIDVSCFAGPAALILCRLAAAFGPCFFPFRYILL